MGKGFDYYTCGKNQLSVYHSAYLHAVVVWILGLEKQLSHKACWKE